MLDPGNREFRAPGKLILMGEYAVLKGAPGVVMAVDRYAAVRRQPDGHVATDLDRLVESARSRAADHLLVPAGKGTWVGDAGALRHGSRKLGIGSSAAITVSAVGSVFHHAGEELEARATRNRIWDLALDIHNEFQDTQGSGLDLAASLFGGCLSMVRTRPDLAPDFRTWEPPEGLGFSFVWTGREASTCDLVGAVRRTLDQGHGPCTDLLGEMGTRSERFLTEGTGDPTVAIRCFHDYGSLMTELGRVCGAPLVTDAMAGLMEFASQAGGAAKPSGAGGGDFLVAAFPPEGDRARFESEARRLGMTPMGFSPATTGLHMALTDADGDIET